MATPVRRLVFLLLAIFALSAPLHAANVTIAWDRNPEPEVRYVVHWGTQHLVYTASASAGTATSYTVANLTAGRTYYFAVQATSPEGLASPLSDEVSFTPATGTTPPRLVIGDFDGDSLADPVVYRANRGMWYILETGTGQTQPRAVQWGSPTDVPVPGDWDGDGRTDIAVWRPATGYWYILNSSSNYDQGSYVAIQWGAPTDRPIPGDYDADGRLDIAVYRPWSGYWYILLSSEDFAVETYRGVQWGAPTDVPMPADYDGDGVTDIAVRRPWNGTWTSSAPVTTSTGPTTGPFSGAAGRMSR